jgi:hypothetical protein
MPFSFFFSLFLRGKLREGERKVATTSERIFQFQVLSDFSPSTATDAMAQGV